MERGCRSVSDIRGNSDTQGPNPLHYLSRNGGAIMDDPIPSPNPAEFGSYENYIAARVDGVRATRGTSRLEITGFFAKTDEDEDGCEESVTIDEVGHFVNLSTGSLRELQTEFWSARSRRNMRGGRPRAGVQASVRLRQGHRRQDPSRGRAPARRWSRHEPGRRSRGGGSSRGGRCGAGRPRCAEREQVLALLLDQARRERRRPLRRPRRKRKGRKGPQ